MNKQILFSLILFISILTINAQVNTPGGTIGSSLNSNVGIGTNNPGSPLEISSTTDNILRLRQNEAGEVWNYIEFYNNTTRKAYVGTDNNGNFQIAKDFGNGNLFLNYGNVGIGINPSYKFHILATNHTNYSTSGYPTPDFVIDAGGSLGAYTTLGLVSRSTALNTEASLITITNVSTGNGNSEIAFGTRNNYEFAEKVRITKGGNVGIGTTIPDAPLEIKSLIPNRGLMIGRENLSTKISLHVAEGNYGYLDLGGYTQLRGNGLNSNFEGNVGIGTTETGSYRLVVETYQATVGKFRSTNVLGPFISFYNSVGQIGGIGSLAAISGGGADMSLAVFAETGNSINFLTNGSAAVKMKIDINGNVGIGCTPSASTKLAVNGKINATEVVVTATVPSSDYVFEKDYKLKSLNEVEEFVNTNKHLPEVPSAAEFKEQGCNVGQMQDVLLKKVEELTLYVIEQNKKIDAQNEEIKLLKKEIYKTK